MRSIALKTCMWTAAITLAAAVSASASTLLTEGFDNVAGLTGSGWAIVNASSPTGSTDWFQGNAGIFTAQSGAPDSYVAANFLAAGFGGTVDDWLMTPELSVWNGDTLTFWTRTEAGSAFPDSLEVWFSPNGASTSISDFTIQLLSINAALVPGGYPEGWTAFTVTLAGLTTTGTGRFGFRYFVDDTSINGNYIGIDSVQVEAVPEPATGALLALGGLALVLARRRRATQGRV